ncbi:bacillithiol biosynthesis cysteine-adding enzyme BshC [Acidobacteriota bacterium]
MTSHIKLPNLSALAYDYYYNYKKVSQFYNGNFRNSADIQKQAERVRSRAFQRNKLAAILEEQNINYGCGKKTLENIKSLKQNQTCVVVTGQQVGLFSGPLYTIYKSFTAIKLAEYLNQNIQGNFVPVFWMASGDHDFAEINHINFLDKDNQIEKIQCESHPLSTKLPASKILLTKEIEKCLKQLIFSSYDSEFKDGIISQLSEAYESHRSYAEAFGKWMTCLFKSYGLIFIDATHRGFKEIGKSVFLKEIAENSPSTISALETSTKLKQAKYNSQIHLREGISNLFLADPERQSMGIENDGYIIKETQQTFSKEGLITLIDKNPVLCSPNVLLRPIYQDTVLPTVATIGGPGEVAYFAQMKDVYETFDIPMPIIFPRKHMTIVENKITRVLQKHNLNMSDFWNNFDQTIQTIIRNHIPKSIESIITETSSHLSSDFKSIKKEIISLDPDLGSSADIALEKIKEQFKYLEKKIIKASKKQNDILIQQLNKVKNNLYPDNHLQERVLNIVPYLIKYGYPFLDKLYKTIDINCHDHQLMEL